MNVRFQNGLCRCYVYCFFSNVFMAEIKLLKKKLRLNESKTSSILYLHVLRIIHNDNRRKIH